MYLLSTLAWLATYCLVALALVGPALALGRQMALPRVARIAFAVAIVPNVLGTWTVGITTLIPGLPSAVVAFAPAVIATVVILLFWRTLWRGIAVAAWNAVRAPAGAALAIIALGSAVFVALLFEPVTYRVSQPVRGSDALQYLDQAVFLAETRDLWAYPGFRGTDDGSLRGDIHGPVWPAYLAHALMSNAVATGMPGPPADLAARMALAASFLSLIAAIAAAALTFRNLLIAPLLACLAFVLTSHTDYILDSSSRDAFRVAPLLCLVALLVGQLKHASILRYPLAAGGLLAATAFGAVGGHTLATVEAPVIVAAWLAVANWWRRAPRLSLLVLAALAIGAVLGGGHFVLAYLETGSPWGSNVRADDALGGTPYESALGLVHDPRIAAGTTTFGLMWTILSRDPLQLAFGTIVGAYFFLRFARRGAGAVWNDVGLPFVGLSTALIAFLLLFAGNLGGLGLTYSAAANFRYVYLWNALASVVISAALALAFAWLTGPRGRELGLELRRITVSAPAVVWAASARFRTRSVAAAAIIVAVVIAIAFPVLNHAHWHREGQWTQDSLRELKQINAMLPADCRYLTDSDLLGYYLPAHAMKLYSMPSRPLFEAVDSAAVDDFMAAHDICFAAIIPGLYLDKAGPDTPVMQYLTDGRHAVATRLASPDNAGRYRIFILRDALRGAPALEVSSRGPEALQLRLSDPAIAGRAVTVRFLERASGGVTIRAGDTPVVVLEGAAGDGWRWTSYTFFTTVDPPEMSVSFAAPADGVFQLSRVVVEADGTALVDTGPQFSSWTQGQPLPAGWSLAPGATLSVKPFE
jgi:hypothetical protein